MFEVSLKRDVACKERGVCCGGLVMSGCVVAAAAAPFILSMG